MHVPSLLGIKIVLITPSDEKATIPLCIGGYGESMGRDVMLCASDAPAFRAGLVPANESAAHDGCDLLNRTEGLLQNPLRSRQHFTCTTFLLELRKLALHHR